ncbi:MAG: glycosyltransferase [Chthoniobacterales bacterium]
MKRKKIVVMGFMGSIPIAGVVWQHIHYIVGLQRLGHEVYYIEDSGRIPYDPATGEMCLNFDYASKYLAKIGAEFGFADRWSFCARFLPEFPTAGLPLNTVRQLYRDADAILNVCGAQEINEDLLASDHLIYVESDPGVEQIKVDQRDPAALDYLSRHCALFTFGENVGTDRFVVPTHDMNWLPTRQPIVTDFWSSDEMPPSGAVFTTIANWSTSGLKDMEWRGAKFLWSKSLEFLRFVEAPARAGEPFEIATTISDPETREKFTANGWRLHPSAEISADIHKYHNYITNSKGEFTAAKDQYVRLNTGWFSDRSACYLASGRPVITQQTGFTDHYGNDGGVIAFDSLGEIVEAVKMINTNYAKHSRAARDLAREVFEAEKVLASLFDRAGI